MYLLKHGTIVTNDTKDRIIKDGYILVNDKGIIEDIGSLSAVQNHLPKHVDQIDLSGHILFPGLIDAHTHASQSLIRGLGGERPLEQWVQEVEFPALRYTTPELTYHGTLVSLIESLRSGVTSIINNHDAHSDADSIDKVVNATRQIGLRTIIARAIRGPTNEETTGFVTPAFLISLDGKEQIELTKQLINKYGHNQDPMLRIWFAPMVISSLNAEDIQYATEVAATHNSGLHIHIAETQTSQKTCLETNGANEIEYLASLDALSPSFHCIHGVWLNDQERNLLAQNKTTLVHNPVSNGILGSGIADITAAMNAGIPIALGTDGAATNNSNNMLETIKVTVLFQRVHQLNPEVITAKQAFEMATKGGAHALGMSQSLGSLEKRYYADIMAVNLSSPQAIPSPDPYAALVYALQSSDVKFVMINGEIRLFDGVVQGIDEQKVLQQAANAMNSLIDKITT